MYGDPSWKIPRRTKEAALNVKRTAPIRRSVGRKPTPSASPNGTKKSPARMHAELNAHGDGAAGFPRSLRRRAVIEYPGVVEAATR